MLILLLTVSARASDSEIDCQGFNPGSAITTCDEINICCNEQRCWLEFTDGDFPTSDDQALDTLCVFQDYGYSPVLNGGLKLEDENFMPAWPSRWMGPSPLHTYEILE